MWQRFRVVINSSSESPQGVAHNLLATLLFVFVADVAAYAGVCILCVRVCVCVGVDYA